jgi:hypothetical protein
VRNRQEIGRNEMMDPRSRPPGGGASSFNDGSDLSRKEAAEYISSLLEGLRLVAHNAQLQFLAYLINVALEEANNEKAARD